jgi:putative oxidoreductase
MLSRSGRSEELSSYRPPKGGGGDPRLGVSSLLRIPYAQDGKGVSLQRLFSAFPNDWPGRGLVLQRVVTAMFLFRSGFGHLGEASQLGLIFPHVIGACAGILLLLGLWTPICGTLIGVVELCVAFSRAGDGGISIMLATSGATLAMTGPGAWSIDSRLFGRKHFEIPHR